MATSSPPSPARHAPVHQPHALDRVDRAQSIHRGALGLRIRRVDLDHGERMTLRHTAAAHRAAQREVRDVDLVVAQDRADAADHAGHILVAHAEQHTGQRRFNVDAVKGDQARRVAVQNRCAGRGVAAAEVQRHLQHIARAAGRDRSSCLPAGADRAPARRPQR